MATTTTNFGWDIPQSTDLVKDGATAIAALGQDIDTALVDLKGGSTGQVLAKATGTDLDFTWATPSSGGLVLIETLTLSNVTSASFTANSFTSTYDNYRIMASLTFGGAGSAIQSLRLRASGSDNTTSNYFSGKYFYGGGTGNVDSPSATSWQLGSSTPGSAGQVYAIDLYAPKLTRVTAYNAHGALVDATAYGNLNAGHFNQTTSFDSATIISNQTNQMSGKVSLYGYAK